MPVKHIEAEALLAMKRYPWPGNVRELENAMQRLVVMTDSDSISLNDLPREIIQAVGHNSKDRFHLPSAGIDLDKELRSYERRWLEEALKHAKDGKSEAARLLGVDRNRLNYLCRKHGL